MSTETETNSGADTSAPGVGGQGAIAPDEIDTEAFDRIEIPDDEDDAPAADKAGEDDAEKTEDTKTAADDDSVEVERNGQKYRVPKALHGELLMQADYTRKTSEHAEAVRTFETEKQSWESQREESRAALPEEHAKVAVLSHELSALDARIDKFKEIDWETWRAQVQSLDANDENRLRYERYRASYTDARDSRIDLVDKLGVAKSDLQTKEDARLSEQRTTAAEAARQARQETGRVLAAEVPGWNQEAAQKVIDVMHSDLGLSPEEIADATHVPLWKLLHAHIGLKAENERLSKALKQHETANGHKDAQKSRPAESPKGGGGGNARDPSTSRGDGLTTAEWMRRRNAQEAAARR